MLNRTADRSEEEGKNLNVETTTTKRAKSEEANKTYPDNRMKKKNAVYL